MNKNDQKRILEKIGEHEQRIKKLESIVIAKYKQEPVKSQKNQKREAPPSSEIELDFSMPIRPFIKKYAKGMSGPKKFVLLLARLTEGDKSKKAALSVIEKLWNTMSSKNLMRMKFNRFYSTTARENDWVESKKQGEYNLRPKWKEIFH